jgi:hypothetical protein
MYLYIELWKVKPEWLGLSEKERGDYMSQLGPAIEGLAKAGVEVVGWGLSDAETPYRGDYRYLAVWKMPNKDLVQQFEETVEQAGWQKYFEQINIRGELLTPEAAIGDMINL